jgi:formylglycine-generating enzyme required for sulfatase activity
MKILQFVVVIMAASSIMLVGNIEAANELGEWTEPLTGMQFVRIPGGCFMMGSPEDEPGRGGRGEGEGPLHEVCVDGFWMGKYEVTQAQWQQIMGENPSYHTEEKVGMDPANHPVDTISWDAVQEFILKLNEEAGANVFRLPSEAEWEYACRAGAQTAYSFGDDVKKLGEYAWFGENSLGKSHPVGQLKPNAYGLYDIHGNVYEWTADPWHPNYDGAPSDGRVWETERESSVRMMRSSSWKHPRGEQRCAYRRATSQGSYHQTIGFRLLRVAEKQ